MAKDGLTKKQENFAVAFFTTGNAAEAYRTAYEVEENARDNWIYVEACCLLDNPKVAQRLKELEAQADELAIFTRSAAMQELNEARLLAMSEGNPAAAVSAINAKAKIAGLDRPTKLEIAGDPEKPIKTEEVGNGAAKLLAHLETIAERSRAAGEPSPE